MQLLFSSDPSEVERLLERGDVAAVLLCGDDDYQSVALAHLIEAASQAATLHLGRPPELKPRVVFAARAAPELLVELFNTVAVDHALPPDAPVAQLRDAVLAACRAHEMQLQQQRMSIELERMLRDRARPVLTMPEGVEGPGFTSARMQQVIGAVRQAAPHRVTVLLQGETGTGKEVLAQRLHQLSPRSRAPFVVQDCGALPETLLESELFGHVKGAFTGAVSDHPGLFVLADGGTIFLDEIENTTPNLQAKLLRVIETGDVRPVGGAPVRRVDVRVVTASNRNLAGGARRAASAPTSTTGSTPSPSTCRRCASGARTCSRWRARSSTCSTRPGQVGARLHPRGRGAAPRLGVAGQRARAAQRGRARGAAVGADGDDGAATVAAHARAGWGSAAAGGRVAWSGRRLAYSSLMRSSVTAVSCAGRPSS